MMKKKKKKKGKRKRKKKQREKRNKRGKKKRRRRKKKVCQESASTNSEQNNELSCCLCLSLVLLPSLPHHHHHHTILPFASVFCDTCAAVQSAWVTAPQKGKKCSVVGGPGLSEEGARTTAGNDTAAQRSQERRRVLQQLAFWCVLQRMAICRSESGDKKDRLSSTFFFGKHTQKKTTRRMLSGFSFESRQCGLSETRRRLCSKCHGQPTKRRRYVASASLGKARLGAKGRKSCRDDQE